MNAHAIVLTSGTKWLPLVGGLTLPERLCHQFAKFGATKVTVVGIDDQEHFLTTPRRPIIEIATVANLGDIADPADLSVGQEERVVVARADRIYANELVARAIRFDGAALLLEDKNRADQPVGLAVLPGTILGQVFSGHSNAGGADSEASQANQQKVAARGPKEVFEAIVAELTKDPNLERTDVAPFFWCPVEGDTDITPARNALFKSLGKPIDGVVSRYLNRPLSQSISKRMCNLPVTPNMISAVVFIIGLGATATALLNTRIWIAVGGILYHLASALDGVDGEIARVKFMSTKFGALLDSILDHIVEVAFIGAISFDIYWNGGSYAYVIMFYAILASVVIGSALVNYDQITKTSTGQPMELQFAFDSEEAKEKPLAKAINSVRFLVGRDVDSLILGSLAVLGILRPIPLMTVIVTSVYFVVVVGHKVHQVISQKAVSGPTSAQ